MFRPINVVVTIACTLGLLVSLGGYSLGDKPDKRLIDSRWQQITRAGKTPVPVYSKDARLPGVINATGGKAIGSNGAVAWTPIGWCVDCSWPVNEGDVFYNVSDASASVRVGNFVLKPGESVVFERGQFRRSGAPAKHANNQLKARAVRSVRGWGLEKESWLIVSVPLAALPSTFRLDQCELLRDGVGRVKAVGVVPAPKAVGSIRGTLEISRDNSPLRLGAFQARPTQELQNPSRGTMRMSFPRDVAFDDVSLYQFRVESSLVVGADVTLRISPTAVQIPAAGDVTIVTEHGWKARLALSKLSALQFKCGRGATVDVLFPVDNAKVRSLAMNINGKSIGNASIAE